MPYADADALADALASSDATKGAALVTFKQTGTGMGARTVYAKAKEALSIGDALPAKDGTTDDTAKFANVITEAVARGGAEVFVPPGDYAVTKIEVPSSVILKGAGGHIGATTLIGTALTDPVVHISGRSAGLVGLEIKSSTARLASATPGVLAHGIHATCGDIAGLPTMSRLLLEDIYVINQPLDGVHITGQIEHSRFDTVTVADCKRHGFALDDGTRAGYSNKTYAFFVLLMTRCRAFECGGNALLAGKSGQAYQPSNLILDHFEALGCCWDSSKREIAQQIGLYNLETLIRQLDCEDQQYAGTTTTSTSMARTGNAAPAEGVLCAASGVSMLQPYFSSLTKCVTVNSGVSNFSATHPLIFAGTYAVAQAVAFDIAGSCTEIQVIGKSQSGATKLVQCLSTLGDIRIDGIPRQLVNSSSFDGGVRDPAVPEQATISGGVLTVPSLNIVVRGEGGAADTLNTFRYVSGINGVGGHAVRLHYGGEDITISNAGDFLFKDSAASRALNASYPVAAFAYNTSVAKWVEQ